MEFFYEQITKLNLGKRNHSSDSLENWLCVIGFPPSAVHGYLLGIRKPYYAAALLGLIAHKFFFFCSNISSKIQ